MSGTPYSSGPHVLVVNGGEEACIEIRTPHRGTVETIKFDQIDGILANAAFEVYTKNPCGAPSSSFSSVSVSEAGDGSIPASAYSIFGEKNYVAGTPFMETNKQYPFSNRDGSPTNPVRKLYVRVLSEGAGPCRYVLTMEMRTSQLN